MKKDTVFFRQAELLLRVLPSVNKEEVFALKGGTAINFSVRDLPLLSVDIDLTYLPGTGPWRTFRATSRSVGTTSTPAIA